MLLSVLLSQFINTPGHHRSRRFLTTDRSARRRDLEAEGTQVQSVSQDLLMGYPESNLGVIALLKEKL